MYACAHQLHSGEQSPCFVFAVKLKIVKNVDYNTCELNKHLSTPQIQELDMTTMLKESSFIHINSGRRNMYNKYCYRVIVDQYKSLYFYFIDEVSMYSVPANSCFRHKKIIIP